jgi:phage terminase large subunit-like protein
VIAVKPERDKKTRMSVESAEFEAGQVYFPESACLLADLEAELFAFRRHVTMIKSTASARHLRTVAPGTTRP